jgi:hypothetical protein
MTVEQGPDLARDGVVRWRCSDLQARLQSDFDVQYHERSVGKLLAKLAFRKMTARPFHPEKDAGAQATQKKLRCPDRSRFAAARCRQTARNLVADAMRADTAYSERSKWQSSATRKERSCHVDE